MRGEQVTGIGGPLPEHPDLLIDYDRAQDVPGMLRGPAVWAESSDALSGDNPFLALEVREGDPDVDRCMSILAARLNRAGYEIVAYEWTNSTNGWHLKVELDPHPAPIESVALQAICGSDPKRESCNVQRAREVERWARELDGTDIGREAVEFWRTRWNVLYQPNPSRKVTP